MKIAKEVSTQETLCCFIKISVYKGLKRGLNRNKQYNTNLKLDYTYVNITSSAATYSRGHKVLCIYRTRISITVFTKIANGSYLEPGNASLHQHKKILLSSTTRIPNWFPPLEFKIKKEIAAFSSFLSFFLAKSH
jgi:hypothetical protein